MLGDVWQLPMPRDHRAVRPPGFAITPGLLAGDAQLRGCESKLLELGYDKVSGDRGWRYGVAGHCLTGKELKALKGQLPSDNTQRLVVSAYDSATGDVYVLRDTNHRAIPKCFNKSTLRLINHAIHQPLQPNGRARPAAALTAWLRQYAGANGWLRLQLILRASPAGLDDAATAALRPPEGVLTQELGGVILYGWCAGPVPADPRLAPLHTRMRLEAQRLDLPELGDHYLAGLDGAFAVSAHTLTRSLPEARPDVRPQATTRARAPTSCGTCCGPQAA